MGIEHLDVITRAARAYKRQEGFMQARLAHNRVTVLRGPGNIRRHTRIMHHPLDATD